MDISAIRDRLKKRYLGRFFLYILSLVYLVLFQLNRLAKAFCKKESFSFVVVCVGNISSGGTGKTTVVLELAKKILQRGLKVAILTRGYKSRYKRKDIIAPDYSQIESFLNDEKASDEHKLLTLLLKEEKIPVVASKNRRYGFRFIGERYNPDVVISDDGFQNFSFRYDYSIVVINPNQIDDRLLPLGNLREPYSGVKRADAVIINHTELFDEKKIEDIEKRLAQYIKKNRIFRSSYKIEGFEDVVNHIRYGSDLFLGRKIAVFSAIGDNEEFLSYLVRSGANPVKVWRYPDHYQYKESDLISIENLRDGLPIVTTMKDAVRILKMAKRIFKWGFYVARVSVDIDERIIDEIMRLK